MISRNDPCWCGSGKKWKKCHYPVAEVGTFKEQKQKYWNQFQILLKTEEQITGIREASQLAASILQALCQEAKEGVTTQALDDLAMKLYKKAGAIPATLGYGSPPYPKSICTSLNEVICHGIPDATPLKNGDIVNIDVSCVLNGYYGDCSAMVSIGEIIEERQRVVDVSYEALMRAIQVVKPGVLLSEIGRVIEDYATSQNTSVVDQFVGHGVGLQFHEAPQVPHHHNQVNIPLAEGMTFTIEPMINAGVRTAVVDPKDKWTARTADGKASAQWEHEILVTKDGHEILTLLK